MKKKLKIAILFIVVIAITIWIFLYQFTQFPGRIDSQKYFPTTKGHVSKFQQGVAYRYPQMPTLLEVNGDHYHRGIQYGVLLRPEITNALIAYEKIIRFHANDIGIPYWLMNGLINYKTGQLAKKLPQRFRDEMAGIAEGSGVREQTVRMVALFADVFEMMGCTAILLKTADGGVIHGRNQDSAYIGGELLGDLTVGIKYRSPGYHTVVQFDWPLFLGIETAYNNKGIGHSANALSGRQDNQDGFSSYYFPKILLEEAGSMEEIYQLVEKFDVMTLEGIIISDRETGEGVVIEIDPKKWKKIPLEKPILWYFDHVVHPEMKSLQHAAENLRGSRSREEVANQFIQKETYEVKDAIQFLRSAQGPGNRNFNWLGSRYGICNWETAGMYVFHPRGEGIYMAAGDNYGCFGEVKFIHDDFSRAPEVFMKAQPIPPVMQETADLKANLISSEKQLEGFINLAGKYAQDANMQFVVAWEAFQQNKKGPFIEYAIKAFKLDSSVPEYALYAGIAEFGRQNYQTVVKRLESIKGSALYPIEEVYRTRTLIETWKALKQFEKLPPLDKRLKDLLQRHNAEEYYHSKIIPKLNQLGLSSSQTED